MVGEPAVHTASVEFAGSGDLTSLCMANHFSGTNIKQHNHSVNAYAWFGQSLHCHKSKQHNHSVNACTG